MHVTLRNADGAEATVTVPADNAIDAARDAKKKQATATGDQSWRVIRARR